MDEYIKYIIRCSFDMGYDMSQRGYFKTEPEMYKHIKARTDEFEKTAIKGVNEHLALLIQELTPKQVDNQNNDNVSHK